MQEIMIINFGMPDRSLFLYEENYNII